MRTPCLHPLMCSGTPDCPAEWMGGIDWPAGAVGASVMVNCSGGVATRECLMEGSWGQPNLFDCLSPVSGPWYMCVHTPIVVRWGSMLLYAFKLSVVIAKCDLMVNMQLIIYPKLFVNCLQPVESGEQLTETFTVKMLYSSIYSATWNAQNHYWCSLPYLPLCVTLYFSLGTMLSFEISSRGGQVEVSRNQGDKDAKSFKWSRLAFPGKEGGGEKIARGRVPPPATILAITVVELWTNLISVCCTR